MYLSTSSNQSTVSLSHPILLHESLFMHAMFCLHGLTSPVPISALSLPANNYIKAQLKCHLLYDLPELSVLSSVPIWYTRL